ncbi:unnamed protein product [Cochlearia groenlandica]
MSFSSRNIILLFIFAVLIKPSISSSRISSLIKLPVATTVASYCESWRLAVETNNVGPWKVVPSKCVRSHGTYLNGGQFDQDYNVVVGYALAYAKTVKVGIDHKDVWVFDIDETLLSNLEYYTTRGYGSVPYNSTSFHEFVEKGTSPAFDASMKLYKGIKKLGFTIILLTGRDERERSITEKNLRYAGYSGWETLLVRGEEDQGKSALQFKSEQRTKMIKKGYKIRGNTGDQWSDLQGFAVADRSFKVPNPLYYVA